VKKAPLEGDRISPQGAATPDFPSPKVMFVTPRWKVSVLCGDVLVAEYQWVGARDAEQAIAYIRTYPFTSAVSYEAEEVRE